MTQGRMDKDKRTDLGWELTWDEATDWMPRALRNFLFGYEILRRLGFQPDDIILAVGVNEEQTLLDGEPVSYRKIFLQLAAQQRTFDWEMGIIGHTPEVISTMFKVAAELWCTHPDEQGRLADMTRSDPWSVRVPLIARLRERGFEIEDTSYN